MKKSIKVFLSICIIYSAVWWVTSVVVKDNLNSQIDKLKNKGYKISYEEFDVSGFPFNFEITLKNPYVSRQVPEYLLFKTEGELCASLSWWSYLTTDGALSLSSKGKAYLEYTSKPYGLVKLSTENLSIKAGLEGEKLNRYLWLNFQRADFQSTSAHVYADNIIFQNFRVSDRDAPTRLKVTFEAHQVDSGLKFSAPIDQKIKFIHLSGRLNLDQTLPRGIPALLNALSREGGVVEVEKADIDWGELVLNANGTLTLDELKQPVASFSATIRGLDKILDELAEQKVIKRGVAQIAKGILSALKESPVSTTELSSHRIPLSLQNGEVSVATIPLFRVSPIRWPEK